LLNIRNQKYCAIDKRIRSNNRIEEGGKACFVRGNAWGHQLHLKLG
jgi:hypothetical protein